MYTIKDTEKRLFEEWKTKQKYQYFISDGVFNEEEWNKQPCKILFVLKEANWENESDDLCDFLLNRPSSTCWKTWNNIARWTKALLAGGEYPSKISKESRSNFLGKIAALNLKKVGGGAEAETKTIREFAENDRRFLKQQIELYTPDIIICCGRGEGKNADILHDVIFSRDEVSDWQEPILQYNYFLARIKDKENIPVISFYHPQMIGGHELFQKRYEEMKNIAYSLREKHLL